MILPTIDPLIAGGVVVTTAFTDAIYVQFTAAVATARRIVAAKDQNRDVEAFLRAAVEIAVKALR